MGSFRGDWFVEKVDSLCGLTRIPIYSCANRSLISYQQQVIFEIF